MSAFDNPYYPYFKVETGYNSFCGAERIPYKLLLYLLDLPDKNGYVPVDDNTRPRVRFLKYIYYDVANPLSYALPTPTQKKSLLFDADAPVIDTDEQQTKHPKGYRLFAQQYWQQEQTEAQTTVKCYIGRVYPYDNFKSAIGITFEILCNQNVDTNTRTNAYSRSYNIEQCIIESLHGVNIAGIGTVQFSRLAHTDNGSRPIYDTGANIGRELKMSILWEESNSSVATNINC